jgi:hypothetical protein
MIMVVLSEPLAGFLVAHLRLYSMAPGEYRGDLHAWRGMPRLCLLDQSTGAG